MKINLPDYVIKAVGAALRAASENADNPQSVNVTNDLIETRITHQSKMFQLQLDDGSIVRGTASVELHYYKPKGAKVDLDDGEDEE